MRGERGELRVNVHPHLTTEELCETTRVKQIDQWGD